MKKLVLSFKQILFLSLMAMLFSMAFISCSDDPDNPVNDDEDDYTKLELTLISGTMYDGTDLFESDPKYKNLKIILELEYMTDTQQKGKYTEMYGSKIDGTGTFTIDGKTDMLTISASSYFTDDWGNKFTFSENEYSQTITLSPEGWPKQKFTFKVKAS